MRLSLTIAAVLALSAPALADDCSRETLQTVNTKWNNELKYDPHPSKAPPSLATLIDGTANCYESAWIKKQDLDRKGCTSRVLVGRLKNGQGHAILEVTNDDGRWYLDNRPGTNGVYHTMRDFKPTEHQ